MSASIAIGMVSRSLRNLLLGEMDLVPAVPVTILTPSETAGNRRVNLYLYKVVEHAPLRNGEWQIKPGDPTRIVPPPLSLTLYYMLTAFAPADLQAGDATVHEILGDAMRVFQQFPVIPALHLEPGLQGAREEFRILLEPPNLEELGNVWSTLSRPYQLSVVYRVSVVQLDLKAAAEKTLARRVSQVGVPDVRAPFVPPEVAAPTPASGPPGTVLTFSGSALDGWQAYVLMTGQSLASGLSIDGESFQVTVPAAAQPGFHELRVDISHLTRRTFFFEVTP
jgi:hypothetical protein